MRGKKREIPAEEGESEEFLWSIGQLARFLELSERTIRRMVNEGMERRRDGRFDARQAVYEFWCRRLLGRF